MKFPITRSIDLEDNKITWAINPEILRIYSYLFFWIIIGCGWYFTKHHSDVDFHNNILIDTFGSNSICLLFDHPPGNYLLPSLWAINYLLLTSYSLSCWLRVYHEKALNHVENNRYIFFTTCTIIEIFSFTVFSTIFAITPEENVAIHTLPYTFLIIGLSILSAKNYIYYQFVTQLTEKEKFQSKIITSIHILASLFKIIFQIFAIFQPNIINDELILSTNEILSIVWILTAAVIPIYTSWKLKDRAGDLEFTISPKLTPF